MEKILKKSRKHYHTLHKETGVDLSSKPTKNLAICNSGLVNGLSEKILFDNFVKFGSIKNILLIPGKSVSFLTYKCIESAVEAFNNCNGTLKIAQDNRPIFLAYVEELPDVVTNQIFNKLPPGLILLENFVSEAEEKMLLNIDFNEDDRANMKYRKVRHFGYEFRYDINNVDKDKPLKEKIPENCSFLWPYFKERLPDFTFFKPDQLTVNHYNPGQGIPHHVDTHSAFVDPLMSLSLGSSIVMDFKHSSGVHMCVLLPARSLAIISGESRYNWTHGIVPRKYDVIYSEKGCDVFERGIRVSYTFRKIRNGKCNCNYELNCDSYLKKQKAGVAIEENVAEKLEKTYVHDVYDNIANHFSDTRHKPWPNILKFVQKLSVGSILVDVGCGNGKYLGLNEDIFNVGCDTSLGLLDCCREKGIETFTCNCLNIPLRDNCADAAICIAVLHHLATEERRLKSIKEIIRVLKISGELLIYVWAKNQEVQNKKSSYLKQNNSKTKENDIDSLGGETNEEVSNVNGVLLPIHKNRTQFKHQNVLVPWKLKDKFKKDEGDEGMFLRFYHVFESGELENVCGKIGNVSVVRSYYDQGNWCILLQKDR